MNNIFQIGGQVFGDSFIGRKAFIDILRKNFIESEMRTSKSIVGLTRVGKSSAVRNCFFDLPKNIIYVYEDLNEWSVYKELWQDICYEVKEQLNKLNISFYSISSCFENMECDDLPWIKLSRSVKKIFGFLEELNIKTILVLDEFDNAATLFSEGTKHFELFRTIFSDGKYNVSAITISRRNLYTIEGSTYQSSTFHGVLDVIPFKGFDDKDMIEYFNIFSKYGIELTDDQKDKIVYYAGNAPYLLSIIGHYIVESALIKEEIDIDKIFLNKCKAINDYYRDCIKHLERDNDLKRIIPFIIGPNIGVTKNDKDELYNLGYFSEKNGKLIAISEYFTEFLPKNVINLNIWNNIINLEKMLKQLVERELARVVGHFSAAGNKEQEVFRVILEKTPGIEEQDISRYDCFLYNNKKVFNIESSYLEVMSMKDTIKIIKDCWSDIFSAYFNNSLFSEWESKLNKCSRARNPIAHGHEEYLTELDKQEVDVYCKQLFDVLSHSIKTIPIANTPYLEVARSNLSSSLNNYDPIYSLLGKTVEMKVSKTKDNKKSNLRGIVEGKYKVVIPKNYLVGVNLEELIDKNIKVKLEKINNGIYEAKLID